MNWDDMAFIPAPHLPRRAGAQRGQPELAAGGLGWAPGYAVHYHLVFPCIPERRRQDHLGRFPPLLESPQPQTKEGLWFPLPSPGSLTSTQTGVPLRPPEAASWGALRPQEGGVNLPLPRSPTGPFP